MVLVGVVRKSAKGAICTSVSDGKRQHDGGYLETLKQLKTERIDLFVQGI